MLMLREEIKTYEQNELDFKESHLGEWVIIQNTKVIGFFKDFQIAAEKVFSEFGDTPVLLRQIGFEPEVYPNIKFATADA
ncbi:hypothetical protein ACJ3XI_03690 [Litorimonas sp. RW-G-Af-16]|uniref:hypothetical protein n=1 Tax=Litorimonas sp. RW-G-Af-16 TaxID=3241168 RepID=UPI00390C906D